MPSKMTQQAFFDFLETASWALLVTGALVLAYVIVQRMKNQMQKGRIQAEMAPLDEVSLTRSTDGKLKIHLNAPRNWNKSIRIVIERQPGEQEVFDDVHSGGPLNLEVAVPFDARGIAIHTPGQHVYKRLNP